MLGIEEVLDLTEINLKYQQAIEEWEKYQQEVKQEREKKMLDMYPEEIVGDSERSQK